MKKQKTEKSTSTWARKLTDWREKNSIQIVAGETSSSELNKILQHFFAELRKKDGTNCEPDSLQTMLGALDR